MGGDPSLKLKRDYKFVGHLVELAKRGGMEGHTLLSSKELGSLLGISQQVASRDLIAMEREGLIERDIGARGQLIRITERGARLLRGVYAELNRIFETKEPRMMLVGEVAGGLKEGAYYVMLPGYREQIIRKLGFDPYPGTLNLRLKGEYLSVRRELELCPGIWIEGFSDGMRSYGGAIAFKALVGEKKLRGAVLLVERTHHDERIIEVISPHNLREDLGLKDGSMLSVEIIGERMGSTTIGEKFKGGFSNRANASPPWAGSSAG